jgi:hypothetical protein
VEGGGRGVGGNVQQQHQGRWWVCGTVRRHFGKQFDGVGGFELLNCLIFNHIIVTSAAMSSQSPSSADTPQQGQGCCPCPASRLLPCIIIRTAAPCTICVTSAQRWLLGIISPTVAVPGKDVVIMWQGTDIGDGVLKHLQEQAAHVAWGLYKQPKTGRAIPITEKYRQHCVTTSPCMRMLQGQLQSAPCSASARKGNRPPFMCFYTVFALINRFQAAFNRNIDEAPLPIRPTDLLEVVEQTPGSSSMNETCSTSHYTRRPSSYCWCRLSVCPARAGTNSRTVQAGAVNERDCKKV